MNRNRNIYIVDNNNLLSSEWGEFTFCHTLKVPSSQIPLSQNFIPKYHPDPYVRLFSHSNKIDVSISWTRFFFPASMHLDSRTWNYWFFDSNSFSLCSNIVHVAHRYKTQVTRICCTGRLLSLITKRARSCRVWQASPWIGNRPSNINCLPWAVVSHTENLHFRGANFSKSSSMEQIW